MTAYIMVATVLMSLFGATASAQSICLLSTFTNGQMVTIRGKVGQAPHDLALEVSGCSLAVVLEYAGDPESGESSAKILKNENFKLFEKYTSATYGRGVRRGICMHCRRYEVEATLTGRLDVASDTVPEGQWKDRLGMLHDQSGKLVGKAGFGHPPIQKYRLVIEFVSDVAARELPRPNGGLIR